MTFKGLIRAFGLMGLISFMLISVLHAEQIKGSLLSISNKAKTIQLSVGKDKAVKVIRFNSGTEFINAKSSKGLIKNDKLLVDLGSDSVAKSIKRLLIELPKEKIISVKKLNSLIAKKDGSFTLADARPLKRYNQGHIVGSVSITPGQIKNDISILPKNKDNLLVFYCGGPT